MVAAREGLTVVLPDQLNGPLQEDFAALRKMLDDDASGALKEYFGDGEDPREWSCKVRRREKSCVTIADGRVTKLVLYECTSLAALPDAIGELKALTTLDLSGCSSLEKLPNAIDGSEGLKIEFPAQLMPGPFLLLLRGGRRRARGGWGPRRSPPSRRRPRRPP